MRLRFNHATGVRHHLVKVVAPLPALVALSIYTGCSSSQSTTPSGLTPTATRSIAPQSCPLDKSGRTLLTCCGGDCPPRATPTPGATPAPTPTPQLTVDMRNYMIQPLNGSMLCQADNQLCLTSYLNNPDGEFENVYTNSIHDYISVMGPDSR